MDFRVSSRNLISCRFAPSNTIPHFAIPGPARAFRHRSKAPPATSSGITGFCPFAKIPMDTADRPVICVIRRHLWHNLRTLLSIPYSFSYLLSLILLSS
jgi:hypothetical protein